MGNRGWFADVDPEMKAEGYGFWQPCIQTDIGCFDIEVWFETQEACEDFIREHLLGKEMLDD